MPATLIKAVGAVFLACAVCVPLIASATGTATIHQPGGDVRTYKNVRIAIQHKQLMLTSADGVGQFVIFRAGCSPVEKLVRCYPYDAVLKQHGETLPITIVDGTAWLNPSGTKQQLPHSSTQLGPHGMMLLFKTKRGSSVSVTGMIDVMNK